MINIKTIDQKKLDKFKIIKDVIIAILLTLLFSLPLLKHFYKLYSFTLTQDYTILKVIGILGAYFFILYIGLFFYRTTDKKNLFKQLLPIFLLTFYMLWTLICSIFSPDQYLAFIGTAYRHDGYITYFLYAGCFGLAFAIDSPKIKKALLYAFSLISIISIILITLAKNGILIRYICNVNITSSSFSNINHYGYYLLLTTSISCFLFITEKNKFLKILNLAMYCYLLYYLILNNTFGCYLALATALIIYVITSFIKKDNRIPCIISIIIFVLISLFSNYKPFNAKNNTKNAIKNSITNNNIQTFTKDIKTVVTSDSNDDKWKKAGSGRMKLWYYGLQFIAEKPILGYGPENLEAKYFEHEIIQDRPHNLLIQLATTSGIPGLILYITAIGFIIFKGYKTLNKEKQLQTVLLFSIIAYMISSMFGNSMYYTSPYFFILLGFLLNELREKKSTQIIKNNLEPQEQIGKLINL